MNVRHLENYSFEISHYHLQKHKIIRYNCVGILLRWVNAYIIALLLVPKNKSAFCHLITLL